MTTHDLYACDNVTRIPGIVYDDRETIRILKIATDDLVSMEPCCGTHVRNTSELENFAVTRFYVGRGRGLFRIEAVTGAAADRVFSKFSNVTRLG